MPYRTTEIPSKVPLPTSQTPLQNNSPVNQEPMNTAVTDSITLDEMVNEKPPKDEKEKNQDGNEETCSLLCRPVPKRTSNMKEEKALDTTIRFHNPPKEIFKPAVEVSIFVFHFLYVYLTEKSVKIVNPCFDRESFPSEIASKDEKYLFKT